jgi:hypothetical protein
MCRLLRLIITLSICFTSLAFACYPGVAGAYHQSGRQFLNQGELEPVSIQLHNPVGIDSGFVEAHHRLDLSDATLGLRCDARCIQEGEKHMGPNLPPTGAQGAAQEFKPTGWWPSRLLALNLDYTAVLRKFGRISESIEVTPEPISLALFGFGLTLVGVTLLRGSRRTQLSRSTQDAHYGGDKNCVRLGRNPSRIQHPVPEFPAPDRLVTTCMPSAPTELAFRS